MLERPATDELAHDRVAAEPVGVIDILASGETRENRLAQKPHDPVTAIPALARIGEHPCRHVHQTEGIVEFTVHQQTAVGADRRALELKPDGSVELEPQRHALLTTGKVRPARAETARFAALNRDWNALQAQSRPGGALHGRPLP